MLVRAGEFGRVLQQCRLDERNPILESAGGCRGVENEVADLVPKIGLVLPADDADGALKFLAVDPKLAVEGNIRQSFDKPVRRVKQVSLAGKELLAIPVGPDAIQLFAHPPARKIGSIVPRLGEQQWRSRGFFSVG